MGHILVPPSGECWYLLLVMGNTVLLRINQGIQYTVYIQDVAVYFMYLNTNLTKYHRGCLRDSANTPAKDLCMRCSCFYLVSHIKVLHRNVKRLNQRKVSMFHLILKCPVSMKKL
jgi:hypothetical protein